MDKVTAYEKSVGEIRSLLQGETHQMLKMATIVCVLKTNLPYYFWTGFYLVDNGELVVGTYQGTLGCLHIAFGRGVCGMAAKLQRSIIVPDVSTFPGHIACDSKTKSEIVIPVFNPSKELIAVFDVDSLELNSFDATDRKYLRAIFREHFTLTKRAPIVAKLNHLEHNIKEDSNV